MPNENDIHSQNLIDFDFHYQLKILDITMGNYGGSKILDITME